MISGEQILHSTGRPSTFVPTVCIFEMKHSAYLKWNDSSLGFIFAQKFFKSVGPYTRFHYSKFLVICAFCCCFLTEKEKLQLTTFWVLLIIYTTGSNAIN